MKDPNSARVDPVTAVDLSDPSLEGGLGQAAQLNNYFAILARHPRLFRRVLALGTEFLHNGALPAADRELVILRVARLTGSEYEWEHHIQAAVDAGAEEGDIHRCLGSSRDKGSSRLDSILGVVDELSTTYQVTNGTWDTVKSIYSEPEIVELLLLIGFYHMTAMVLNAVRVPLEDTVKGSLETAVQNSSDPRS